MDRGGGEFGYDERGVAVNEPGAFGVNNPVTTSGWSYDGRGNVTGDPTGRTFGPFRFMLVDEARSWAISCNEWYNLFAGQSDLLESLLGKSIDHARRQFAEFASMLAKGKTDEPLMPIAERYAAV